MPLEPELARLISASLMRLQTRSPFFAALALFARFEASAHIPTAATDGRDVFVNPEFFGALSAAEQDGLLAHEVLHAALLHVPRRGDRDAPLWNIAADIVINGMLIKDGYHLPPGGVRKPELEQLSAEEVYEALSQNKRLIPQAPAPADLVDRRPGAPPEAGGAAAGPDQAARGAALEKHWENARREAQMALEATAHGTLPAHLKREFGQAEAAQLDWRSYLWRFLVQTPTDFTGFDRRFIGRRLYLETLTGESVHVHVAVDTSGSINARHLRGFLSEVQAILRAYPHIRCDLYFADAALDGPHPLHADSPLPTPKGGGGTDFRPFFQQVAETQDSFTPLLAIYLTDGFGRFPVDAPNYPVLWVVTPGGRDLGQFPFGEVVRLVG